MRVQVPPAGLNDRFGNIDERQMMCFDYGEYYDFYKEYVRKSRKLHLCSACGSRIECGDLYVDSSGGLNGSLMIAKLCGACEHTIYRIHLHEIKEGCSWSESWCGPEELMEYCSDSGTSRSTKDEGQAYLKIKRAEQDAQMKAVREHKQKAMA